MSMPHCSHILTCTFSITVLYFSFESAGERIEKPLARLTLLTLRSQTANTGKTILTSLILLLSLH